MEIERTKLVKVDAKTVRIHTKCTDRFQYSIEDADGEVLVSQDDGYVPGFMPGPHYGDYIILDIDIDTGVILNWPKLTPSDIEEAINKTEE